MPITASPLRYPGGKSRLLPLVSSIIRENKMQFGAYAEPYAGGCGLALELLFGSHVSEIHINDIDPAIWAFWHSVLTETERFVDLVAQTPVTVEEWHKQKAVQSSPMQYSLMQQGFSAFFLNRTNRSGIIKGAGMIGGMNQDGNYKLDCRYNKEGLIRRIRRIKKYEEQIFLHNKDAIEFMTSSKKLIPEDAFVCVDPPYYNKGKSLYTSFYSPEDHAGVADAVLSLKQPWIVTYDNVSEVKSLYKTRRQFSFDINYSVQKKRVGNELLVVSKKLRIPKELPEQRQLKAA